MLRERVEEALNTIRPALQLDGGDVMLVDVNEQDGIVRVQLQGACSRVSELANHARHGIERAIKDKVPEVKEVLSV